MKIKVLIEGILFLFIGLLSITEGFILTTKRNPQMLYDILGPGLYVFGLGLLSIATGIVHIIGNYGKIAKVKVVPVTKEMRVRLISMIAVYALYTYLIGIIGYLVATIIFFFLEFRIVGIKSLMTNLILTLIISVANYIVFVLYCNVAFPKGIFL